MTNRHRKGFCTACLVLFAAVCGGILRGQQTAPACSQCAVWNVAQKPFRLYGETYYVGTHGLSSILIRTDGGLVLIDGALPESAPLVAGDIRGLGFRVEDVKVILNTHAHYDHAGGIAELQRMSGAEVVVSAWSAEVLRTGKVMPDDPQYGSLPGMVPVERVRVLWEGETVKVGATVLTPHATPGHTPGGTSWTWESCEVGKCLGMVYADSISAVSAEGYKYSAHPEVLAGFRRSFGFLEGVKCDVLVTPHPEASGLWDRVGGKAPLVDGGACKRLAGVGREMLEKRVAAGK